MTINIVAIIIINIIFDGKILNINNDNSNIMLNIVIKSYKYKN
jgi:hypothetical protein